MGIFVRGRFTMGDGIVTHPPTRSADQTASATASTRSSWSDSRQLEYESCAVFGSIVTLKFNSSRVRIAASGRPAAILSRFVCSATATALTRSRLGILQFIPSCVAVSPPVMVTAYSRRPRALSRSTTGRPTPVVSTERSDPWGSRCTSPATSSTIAG